jgi:hypothetical protein
MSGWRQAVFVRQRRIDVIQRALSKVLDEESWSPATPRRLHIGAADASPRGWTRIVPELANFFLDRGGLPEPRLCRLARALGCPAYEVDVRDPDAAALYEADDLGRLRISGAAHPLAAEGGDEVPDDAPPVSPIAGFGLIAVTDEIRDRVAALAMRPGRRAELADCLGAVAGFPAWTQKAGEPSAGRALVYEPPRILARDAAGARITARLPGTRAATARTEPRAVRAPYDRRGRRPRSVAQPRR